MRLCLEVYIYFIFLFYLNHSTERGSKEDSHTSDDSTKIQQTGYISLIIGVGRGAARGGGGGGAGPQ